MLGCALAATVSLSPAYGQSANASAPTGLMCDDSLKTAFQPDAQTSVVLVKQFRAGEIIRLAKDNPAMSPPAAQDLCLVKLNVGPGNPGPVNAPSTSKGIGIEIWLPSPAKWDGRIHAMGGGGWQGGAAGQPDQIGGIYAAIAASSEGSVTSTTDTGHAGGPALGTGNPRGDFAMNPDGSLNKALLHDFSVRSIHEQALKTKALTAAFYGRPAARSYWEGGSTGGRQGHKLAQAYPADFDGIIANYPALNWSAFAAGMVYPQIVIERDLGGKALTNAQLDLVSNAAINACDAIGGIHLGFVMDPAQCRYDPTKDNAVLCRGDGGTNQTSDCVTRLQAQAVNKMWYGPTRDGSVPDPAIDNGWEPIAGKHIWYGPARGTSLWNAFFTRSFGFPAGLANAGAGSSISSDVIALVTGDPTMAHEGFKNAKGVGQSKFRTLSYAQLSEIISRSEQRDATTFSRLSTNDPDLSAFRAKGGKMLVWQGYNDEVIPPQGIGRYYDSVIAKMGGVNAVQSFYRLYYVPGNGHMSPNGTANPDANPPVIPQGQFYQALINWVEKGIAPSAIEMHSPGDKPVRRSHPACAYPQKVTYTSGDPNTASSFVCR
nr:tannase/feruloyl esterase family alpha/beta hydrolase [Sphingobium boeckii]